jgi:hypothetical protein
MPTLQKSYACYVRVTPLLRWPAAQTSSDDFPSSFSNCAFLTHRCGKSDNEEATFVARTQPPNESMGFPCFGRLASSLGKCSL